MSAKNKKTILLLLVAAVLLAVVPFFAKKGAEFGGSDDAGSVMVEEIKGEAYEPWFTPVIESLTGSELPGEICTDRDRSWCDRISDGKIL